MMELNPSAVYAVPHASGGMMYYFKSRLDENWHEVWEHPDGTVPHFRKATEELVREKLGANRDAVIEEMHYKDGNVQLILEHPLVAHMAFEFARLFKEAGGVNYVSFNMQDKTDNTVYNVCIRPETGKPMQVVNSGLRRALRELLEASMELAAKVATTQYSECERVIHKITDIADRVREEYPDMNIDTSNSSLTRSK
jgi:hypothetical protein